MTTFPVRSVILVGERGPELFVPARYGRVEPERPIVEIPVTVGPDLHKAIRQAGKAIAAAIGRALESDRIKGI